jgi:hypothetical protein
VVKTGKTSVLEGAEWRKLLKSIPDTTLRDLRDRALIATLTYSFARITAALKMKVEDFRPRGGGWPVRPAWLADHVHRRGGSDGADRDTHPIRADGSASAGEIPHGGGKTWLRDVVVGCAINLHEVGRPEVHVGVWRLGQAW